ncbi:MAG: MotA/TolQ/ExbB proton channel family protein [Myxococcota bacterium]|nr:MotA/TolQ/ExbB proton channel family protein [Myxococcota bacterium]
MYAITAVLALAVAITLERAWLLVWRWSCDTEQLEVLLDKGQLSEAIAITDTTPLGDVIRAGASDTDPELAWEAMSNASIRAEARIRTRISYLATISNLATMLGLLGTVYGLIVAFSGLGDTAAAQRATGLSEGISTAMATTAYGLLVGIPSLALHAWLEARAQHQLVGLESAAGRLTLGLRRASSTRPGSPVED